MISIVRTDETNPGGQERLNSWEISISHFSSNPEETPVRVESCDWGRLQGALANPVGKRIAAKEAISGDSGSPGVDPQETLWAPVSVETDSTGAPKIVSVSCVVLDIMDVPPELFDDIISSRIGFGWMGWIMHLLPEDEPSSRCARIVFPLEEALAPEAAAKVCQILAFELASNDSIAFEYVSNDSFDVTRKLKWPPHIERREHWTMSNVGFPIDGPTMLHCAI